MTDSYTYIQISLADQPHAFEVVVCKHQFVGHNGIALHDIPKHERDQILFSGEKVVEGRVSHIGSFADRIDADFVVPLFTKQFQCRIDDGVPYLRVLSGHRFNSFG